MCNEEIHFIVDLFTTWNIWTWNASNIWQISMNLD